MKPLTDEKRKDVFIVDDSLFDRSRSKKTELLAKVFGHCSMKYLQGFCLLDEMEDITFSCSMCIIIYALINTVMEYFHITEVQLEEFTASFVQRLPKYMQDALERRETAA